MTRFIFTLCLILSSSSVSFTSWATTLTVSDNLIVSKINNKKVEHGFISNNSDFSLESGQHALVIHYKDVFEDLNFAEHRVIESKEFVVKITVKNEKTLTLMTSKIKNLAQAEAFSKTPTLILKDENNQELVIELENIDEYKMAEQVELALNTYALKEDKIVATKQAPILPTYEKTSSNKLIQIEALPMLKYWWQHASDEDKRLFTQYMTSKN